MSVKSTKPKKPDVFYSKGLCFVKLPCDGSLKSYTGPRAAEKAEQRAKWCTKYQEGEAEYCPWRRKCPLRFVIGPVVFYDSGQIHVKLPCDGSHKSYNYECRGIDHKDKGVERATKRARECMEHQKGERDKCPWRRKCPLRKKED